MTNFLIKASVIWALLISISRPRFWPLVSALVTVVAIVSLIQFFVWYAPYFAPRKWTDANNEDFFNYISYEIVRLKHTEMLPREPSIVVLGGSQVRRGMYGSQSLNKTLEDRQGYKIEVTPLAGVHNNPLENLIIVDNLPINKNTIVYISTAGLFKTRTMDALEGAFCNSRIRYVNTDNAENFITERGGNIKCRFSIMRHVTALAYYLTERWKKSMLFKPLPEHRVFEGAIINNSIFGTAFRGEFSNDLFDLETTYSDDPSENTGKLTSLSAELINAIKKSVESRGGHLIYINMPKKSGREAPNPIKRFFSEIGVPLLDMNQEELGLKPSDFADPLHLNGRSGRKKFFHIFTSMINYHLSYFGIRSQNVLGEPGNG